MAERALRRRAGRCSRPEQGARYRPQQLYGLPNQIRRTFHLLRVPRGQRSAIHGIVVTDSRLQSDVARQRHEAIVADVKEFLRPYAGGMSPEAFDQLAQAVAETRLRDQLLGRHASERLRQVRDGETE